MKRKSTPKKKSSATLTAKTALTKDEANAMMLMIDKFFQKLRKQFGISRFDTHCAIIASAQYEGGCTLTNLRGNLASSQFAMACALNVITKGVAKDMKLDRESILLYCITDLGKAVRNLWNDEPVSTPPPPSKNGPTTKVPIQPIE